ncbi:MAG: DUF86 domain-containing protein [Candidatus Omnitrophica bacterium]|nr:DUF86 domain-containing protein [Candidatus Omnitrophota bacterium]MBU4468541.1 DUF86 domain-containing protein [Candidatus Omnitrophota bacterium]MCG2707756.1 DUF86 domain-containing protein [Candidatus Omnitrophota bacterium]
MVDATVVRRILASLNENLQHLKSKQGVSFEEYKKDPDIQAIVERKLETAIQACIDIGNHIVSQQNFGSPSDYGEIFTILAQKGVISDKEAEKLIKMAGFRNIIIHEYRDILIEKVYDIFQNRLGDFYEFAEAILDYLKQN